MNKGGAPLFLPGESVCDGRSFSVASTSEAFSHPPIVNTGAGEYEKMKPLKDSPLLHIFNARRKFMNNMFWQ